MSDSNYRLVYNWGKHSIDVCDVQYAPDGTPYAYFEVEPGTAEDQEDLADPETPEGRIRAQLMLMLKACDRPVLRFPEDFQDA